MLLLLTGTGLGFLIDVIALVLTMAVPLVHRLLRRRDGRWSNGFAVALMFLPGLEFATAALILNPRGFLEAVGYGQTLSAALGPYFYFVWAVYWFVTAGLLLIWWLCEWAPWRRERPRVVRSRFPNTALACLVPLLLLLSGLAAVYVARYETLLQAVESGDVELARRRLRFNLLGSDANLGHRGPHSVSLLPVATRAGNIEMVQLLLDHGADVSKVDGPSRHPPLLDPAIYRGEFDIVTVLIDAGANPSGGIKAASSLEETDILEFLLEHGGNPGWGVCSAARANAVGCLRLLLDAGADPNLRPHETPIQAAVRGIHLESVELLLERGADPSVRTWHRNETLLHLLAEGKLKSAEVDSVRIEQMLSIAKLLVAHGVNPLAVDRNGQTPLTLAEKEGHVALAAYLRSGM